MQKSQTRSSLKRSAILLTLILAGATMTHASENTPAKTRVARQGKYVVRQLVTPDFDLLPLDRKLFAFYIAQAIEAGRDIAWQQTSHHGLDIRLLIDGMLMFAEYYSPVELAALQEYAFKLYALHGNYDVHENKKFIPEGLTKETFIDMAARADKNAKSKKVVSELKLSVVAENLIEHIFNPELNPSYIVTEQEGDVVADSNSNYYGKGVTKDRIEQAGSDLKTHFLSYPELDANGNLQLTLHKIGGRFSNELAVVDYFLGEAQKYGNSEEKVILEAYRKAAHTGDPKDQLKADELWVQYKPTDLDFMATFVETYQDPLDVRGGWEGFVLLRKQDEETKTRVERIRANADYYEKNMPVDEAFKKAPGFTPPKAEAAYIVFTGGENGERPFAGVNLPNDASIHAKYGSKSYTADNVMNEVGRSKAEVTSELNDFYFEKYHALLKTIDLETQHNIQVEFHEILGHGSGKLMEGVNDKMFGGMYSPLEEGRAEVASLYQMLDPKTRDFGIYPEVTGDNGEKRKMTDEELKAYQEFAVVSFFTSHLRSFYKLSPNQKAIRQAHQWGRQVMMNRLVAEGGLKIHTYGTDAAPKVEVVNFEQVRKSLGLLWADIQKARSTGDVAMAEKLFNDWGQYTDADRELRKGIEAEVVRLNLPKESIFLNPKFVVERGPDGNPINVKLAYLEPASDIRVAIDYQMRRALEGDNLRRECEKALLGK